MDLPSFIARIPCRSVYVFPDFLVTVRLAAVTPHSRDSVRLRTGISVGYVPCPRVYPLVSL